jgi:hypothetical protein
VTASSASCSSATVASSALAMIILVRQVKRRASAAQRGFLGAENHRVTTAACLLSSFLLVLLPEEGLSLGVFQDSLWGPRMNPPHLSPRRFNVRGTHTHLSRTLAKGDEVPLVDFRIQGMVGRSVINRSGDMTVKRTENNDV